MLSLSLPEAIPANTCRYLQLSAHFHVRVSEVIQVFFVIYGCTLGLTIRLSQDFFLQIQLLRLYLNNVSIYMACSLK